MELKFDKRSNVTKVDPSILAEAEEEFLIYSPAKCTYLFMSKDPSISDKLHTKLEAHETREFDRNLFKLKKVEGKECYHLLNVKTEKFVYISGDHVLGMGGDPCSHHDVDRFEFAFEKDVESGCFIIKHAGKSLHISDTVAGIPPCHVIHTKDEVTDGSNIFQLTLEKVCFILLITLWLVLPPAHDCMILINYMGLQHILRLSNLTYDPVLAELQFVCML